MAGFVRGDADGRNRGGVEHGRRQPQRAGARVVVIAQDAAAALHGHILEPVKVEQPARHAGARLAAAGEHLGILVYGRLHPPLGNQGEDERRQGKDKIHRIEEKHTNLLSNLRKV